MDSPDASEHVTDFSLHSMDFEHHYFAFAYILTNFKVLVNSVHQACRLVGQILVINSFNHLTGQSVRNVSTSPFKKTKITKQYLLTNV